MENNYQEVGLDIEPSACSLVNVDITLYLKV